MKKHNNSPVKKMGAFFLTVAFITVFAVTAFGIEPSTLPTGGQVTSGTGSIAQTGNAMTINQQTNKMIVNWNTFNIGQNAAVAFRQPGASSVALNRIQDQNPSQIYGSLTANGQVFLLNSSGIYFSPTAQVDVGGLVASSLNITNEDFLAGRNIFETSGNSGAVLNQGSLRAANGGYIAFISPKITNEGTITATNGMVAMAAGDKVSLDFTGDNLVNFTIDKGAVDALIENKGLIQADAGTVILSAGAANSLTSAVVNNSGVIEAKTLANKSGRILLISDMDSGETIAGGRLDASAPDNGDGGFIETSAAKVTIKDDLQVTTKAANGNTGTWLIDPFDFTIAAGGGDMTGAAATTALASTNLEIQSNNGGTGTNGDIFVNDTITWSVNKLTLNAYRNIEINNQLNGSGTAQLSLLYGQGAVASGNTATYSVNAPVNLPAGNNFFTTLGSDGVQKTYTVITSLGDAGSATAADLQGMAGNLSGYYALGGNIDASATGGWNSGAGFAPIGNSSTQFTGIFDGLGHTITGLTIYRPSTDYVGLFGYIDGGSVSNVGMVGGAVTGDVCVGGLVGLSEYSSSIIDSYATGAVTGNGIYVGGLVGENFFGTVINSYATGAVTGSDGVGGLVGENFFGTVINSYATGAVTGNDYVGGLVGLSEHSSIIDSYTTGAVTGNGIYVGGLVGGSNHGTVTNSFWDTDTSGQSSSDGGTGLTTAQMMQQANFTGWDFTDTWWMREDNTRPFLRMEYSTTITNAHQLQLMGMNPGTLAASYTLAADIDMAELSQVSGLWNTTTGFAPVGDDSTSFTGSFDGLGHTITGLTIYRPSTDYVGLFGYIDGGSVSNVGMVGGAVTGDDNVGGLVGKNFDGTVTNSYATGAVTGDYDVGGLVGFNNNGTVINSYATGAVTGEDCVGGLVGVNLDGTVTDSYATGVVTGGDSLGYVGGLVGENFYGTVINSYATGAVTGEDCVGGLVGENFYGTVTNSYATGAVTGNDGVGGLVGVNYHGTVTDSYATGSVTGNSFVGGLVGENGHGTVTDSYATGVVTGNDYVGGLVGYNYATVTNSYATGSVTGNNGVGGLVGFNYDGTVTDSFWDTETSGQSSSAVGTGKTTAEMKDLSTFSSWDIDDAGGTGKVWRIYDGHTYPLLRNFMTLATATVTVPGTKVYDATATVTGGSYAWTTAIDTGKIYGTALYTSASKNVGTQTVTLSGLYSSQQGYDIDSIGSIGSIDITAKAITSTGITANNKVYDATTAVTLNTGSAAITGGASANDDNKYYTGDSLTLETGGASGAFADKNVDTGKAVTVSGLTLSGADAGNYTITDASGATADITAKALTAAYTGMNKIYDAATTATVTGSSADIIAGDTVTFSQAANFIDKNVGTGKTVNITDIALGGTDGGNYALTGTTATATADIIAAPLTVTANDDHKTYSGVAYSGGNGVTYSGFVGGETPAVLGGTLQYAGTSQGAINVGTYGIDPSGLTSGNYAITFSNGVLTITNITENVNAALTDTMGILNHIPRGQGGNTGGMFKITLMDPGTGGMPNVILMDPGTGSESLENFINTILIMPLKEENDDFAFSPLR